MGKRSDFRRRPQDAYFTPRAAFEPLVSHLPQCFTFVEPCAGDGRLIGFVQEARPRAECLLAMDIEPASSKVKPGDALVEPLPVCDLIITNPPWTRQLLHDMIWRFLWHAPTWLLFDGDWLFTKQARPFLPFLKSVVTVGRVSWMENGIAGKDNAAWFHFDTEKDQGLQFFGKGEIRVLSDLG